MRPHGIGRDGLLMRSSSTAEGVRWLDILKTSRLIQTRTRPRGMRDRIEISDGDEFVVRSGPERALQRPKIVVGIAKVVKSDAVKR